MKQGPLNAKAQRCKDAKREKRAGGIKRRPLPADNGADARRWGEEEFQILHLRELSSAVGLAKEDASSAGRFLNRLRPAALCFFDKE